MIRNLDSFYLREKPRIYFDRAYPDRMYKILKDMVEKYSSNKSFEVLQEIRCLHLIFQLNGVIRSLYG
jgi:hypothetical protein